MISLGGQSGHNIRTVEKIVALLSEVVIIRGKQGRNIASSGS